MTEQQEDERRVVAFFHPDLGIGGAERLVVDAAVGLKRRGNKVVIFTSHCDPKHCFDECRDGTLDVRVRGNWLFPPSVFGRLTILCAILRQLHLLISISLDGELYRLKPHVFFVDQLSAGLPLLQWRYFAAPIFFYCHFPDQLLARGREQWWKRLYRVPFDLWEEWSMGFANAIAVNSEFTKGIVAEMWPALAKKPGLKVVYPCVDTKPKETDLLPLIGTGKGEDTLFDGEKVVLSINRFERKKDVGLAIRAFAALPESKRKGVRLVIAGGYDPRVQENVQHHAELEALVAELGLQSFTSKTIITALSAPSDVSVLFLLSVPNSVKTGLLKKATLLVYTPANEHFGIVPLEAMLAGTPVLAANTGGPRETVLDGRTGWLRDPSKVEDWTTVMAKALSMTTAEREKMGREGMKRVKGGFAQEKMAERLDKILDELEGLQRKPPVLNSVLNFAVILLTFGVGMALAQWIANVHPPKRRA